MKKLTALALGLGLAWALSLSALAAGSQPETVTPPAPAAYSGTLVLNGTELNTAGLPPAPAPDLIPLRLLAEADHGAADWDQESYSSRFYLEGCVVTVDCATGAVTVDGSPAEGTAQIRSGVTFVPAAVLDKLEGYSVNRHPELNTERIDIATPNGDPMIQLLYQLADTAGIGYSKKASAAELEEYKYLSPGAVTRGAGLLPMMTSPDTLILCRAAEGKLDQVKTDLEAYRNNQEDTFSWYLSQNLPKVQNAQTVVSGDWVFFVIAEHAEEAVAQFQAAAAALE